MDWLISIQRIVDYLEVNIGDDSDIDILASKIYTSQFCFQIFQF
jgi:hypothetical protein